MYTYIDIYVCVFSNANQKFENRALAELTLSCVFHHVTSTDIFEHMPATG